MPTRQSSPLHNGTPVRLRQNRPSRGGDSRRWSNRLSCPMLPDNFESLWPTLQETYIGPDLELDEKDERDIENAAESCKEAEVKLSKPKRVGMLELFRFADRVDKLLMVLGSLAAIAAGCALPINFLLYGSVVTEFVGHAKSLNATMFAAMANESFAYILQMSTDRPSTPAILDPSVTSPVAVVSAVPPGEMIGSPTNISDMITPLAIKFTYVALGMWIGCFVSISLWQLATERQLLKIRVAFFRSILRQEIGWFDTHGSGELNAHLSDDLQKIALGMGDKMAVFLQMSTMFVGGYTMALIQSWKIALGVIATTPLILISWSFTTKLLQSFSQKESLAYAKAGGIAEEVLAAIRTVVAFHGEENETERYSKNLYAAQKVHIKKGLFFGLGFGAVWLGLYLSFAVALWIGMFLYQKGEIEPGVVLQAFFGTVLGSLTLAQAIPNIEGFSVARASAACIFELIDRVSEIDSFAVTGKKPKSLEGNIEFKAVSFSYPSRPDVPVLRGLSFTVNRGTTVALVGASGCGKSTVIQLLQRFYDPLSGMISLDGYNLRDINLSWLRHKISVVSQEPVLFATTIAENIRLGGDDVTQADMEEAAHLANAHGFISQLPLGYETLAGDRGMQLSGGQKQRIAIARALVRNPTILLLDEATSALDSESEAIVQDALEKAQAGRTTIIIAHRLSTIRNANVIMAFDGGVVKEMGSHEELIKKQGIYYNLYQQIEHSEDHGGMKKQDSVSKASVKSPEESHTGDYDNLGELEDEIHRALDDLERGLESEDDHDVISDGESAPILNTNLKRAPSNKNQPSTHSTGIKRIRSGVSTVSESTSLEKSMKDDNEEEDAAVPEVKDVTKRLLRMNSPEAFYIVAGCLSAVLNGALYPAFPIIMAEILKAFAITDRNVQSETTNILGGALLASGVVRLLLTIIQFGSFGKAGACLIMRIRQYSFRALLRQDIGWFDRPENQLGSLTTQLSNDTSQVEGASGVKLGHILSSLATVAAGLVVAFIFGWKLAFVCLAFFPVMVVAGVISGKTMSGATRGDKKFIAEAGKISVEAVENIRTVVSLGKENYFLDKYTEIFLNAYYKSRRSAFVQGFLFGLTQGVVYFMYAGAFRFGGYLVEIGEMEFQNVFKVFSTIAFSGMEIGRTNSLAPNYTKAKVSAGRLFALLDREPPIDSSSADGDTVTHFRGDIQFKDVWFHYATRAGAPVLRGLTLDVQSGQTLALVGGSGCGKSTAIQLLERFYDAERGKVMLDGWNIKSLNVNWARKQIGIVSQEPVLFDRSIRENIAYGDTSRTVPMTEIIQAARDANIHSFINDLPAGYETLAGDKGAQLSGGQKQRISIARALIRKPKLLLLDEATSALDSQSERTVQEALDKARAGRTCIVIAHRLSTIQNANKIAVIRNGKVVELGNHSELMALQGHYHRLHQTQTRGQSPQ